MDRISALMDGELDEREAGRELERLRQDGPLRERWDIFHVIGDAVRGDNPLSADFVRRVSESLRQEPTVLAPVRRRPAGRITAYALSAAASVSAVAMVAWVAVSTGGIGLQPEIAAAPSIPAAPVQQAVPVAVPVAPVLASVPDEGRMSEYLLAHQGFSPSTALQGVAPYIRSVSARQGDISR